LPDFLEIGENGGKERIFFREAFTFENNLLVLSLVPFKVKTVGIS
jgi:hypothetical protein